LHRWQSWVFFFRGNRAIQKKHGNRNPLVDFPELVEKVDFAQGPG